MEALTDTRVRDILKQIFQDEFSALLDSKLATFTSTLDTLSSDVQQTQASCKKLEDDCKALSLENKTLHKELSELKEYSRRDDLVIYGIQPTSYTEAASSSQSDTVYNSVIDTSNDAVEEAVVQLCSDFLGIPVSKQDISVAHRLGLKKRGNSTQVQQGPSPIIVRFTHRKTRDAVLKARKHLKSVRPGVYINEHLTQENALLFRQARLLVKQKKLISTWTSNGHVYTKDSDLPLARPARICKISDLPQ